MGYKTNKKKNNKKKSKTSSNAASVKSEVIAGGGGVGSSSTSTVNRQDLPLLTAEDRNKILCEKYLENFTEEENKAITEAEKTEATISGGGVGSSSTSTVNRQDLPLLTAEERYNILFEKEIFTEEENKAITEAETINLQGNYVCNLVFSTLQSLFNMKSFVDGLKDNIPNHKPFGQPCIMCSFKSSLADSSFSEFKSVLPLIEALKSKFPKIAEVNCTPYEIFYMLLHCVHASFRTCPQIPCIVHTLFGIRYSDQVACEYCFELSRSVDQTMFGIEETTERLIQMKVNDPSLNLNKVFKIKRLEQLCLDTPCCNALCRELNASKTVIISTRLPSAVSLVLVWGSEKEIGDIVGIIGCSLEIELYELYDSMPKGRHGLSAMVVFDGNVHCALCKDGDGNWMLYKDEIREIIGSWNEVSALCKMKLLQPQFLIYEVIH